MRKPGILFVLLLPFAIAAAAVAAPRLTLEDAEKRALELSPRLKASGQDVTAAREQSDAQWATLLPRLSLEGNFRYATHVPELTLAGRTTAFGDNRNYSIGPTLSYTLWDQGSGRDAYRSLEALADSRSSERDAAERQALASARMAYIRLQLAQQEFQLVERSLELTRSQSRDIAQRLRAGAASRLDGLNADREVSNFELRLAQSRADLEDAAKDLASQIGGIAGDPTALELDSLAESAKAVKPDALAAPDASLPQLRAQEQLAESAELAARSQSALHWPLVQLQARASWDYPDGPNLHQIQQDQVLFNLSLPLWDWGRASSLTAQKRAEAESFRDRRQQVELDARRDWEKASFRLRSLQDQRESAARAARQSSEAARLTYDAYRAGRVNLLDVQSSNLRLLESQVQQARIDAQLLIQYHLLRSLAGDGSHKESAK